MQITRCHFGVWFIALAMTGCQSPGLSTAKSKSSSPSFTDRMLGRNKTPYTEEEAVVRDARDRKKPIKPPPEGLFDQWPPQGKSATVTASTTNAPAPSANESSEKWSISSWFRDGQRFEELERWDQAKKSYENILNVDATHADAHHRLAVIADIQQDYATAEDHYQAALRTKPKDPELLSDLGYSNFKRQRLQDSERYYLSALELDPSHRRTLNNLGLLYSQQNRFDDALAVFRKAGTEEEAQRNVALLFPDRAQHQLASTAWAADPGSPSSAGQSAAATGPFGPQPGRDPNAWASDTPVASQSVAPVGSNRRTTNPSYDADWDARPAIAPAAREPETLAGGPLAQQLWTEDDARNPWARGPRNPETPQASVPNRAPNFSERTFNTPGASTATQIAGNTGRATAPGSAGNNSPQSTPNAATGPSASEFWAGAPVAANPSANAGSIASGNRSAPTGPAGNPADLAESLLTEDRSRSPRPTGSPSGTASSRPAAAGPASADSRRLAAQLGMAAGPGRMFPSVSSPHGSADAMRTATAHTAQPPAWETRETHRPPNDAATVYRGPATQSRSADPSRSLAGGRAPFPTTGPAMGPESIGLRSSSDSQAALNRGPSADGSSQPDADLPQLPGFATGPSPWEGSQPPSAGWDSGVAQGNTNERNADVWSRETQPPAGGSSGLRPDGVRPVSDSRELDQRRSVSPAGGFPARDSGPLPRITPGRSASGRPGNSGSTSSGPTRPTDDWVSPGSSWSNDELSIRTKPQGELGGDADAWVEEASEATRPNRNSAPRSERSGAQPDASGTTPRSVPMWPYSPQSR